MSPSPLVCCGSFQSRRHSGPISRQWPCSKVLPKQRQPRLHDLIFVATDSSSSFFVSVTVTMRRPRHNKQQLQWAGLFISCFQFTTDSSATIAFLTADRFTVAKQPLRCGLALCVRHKRLSAKPRSFRCSVICAVRRDHTSRDLAEKQSVLARPQSLVPVPKRVPAS